MGETHQQTPCQMLMVGKLSPLRFFLIFFLAFVDTICRMMEKKVRKMMENMIVLNTVSELRDFLNSTMLDTLVNRVAFAMDLLETARANNNQIDIDDDLGFANDGGWIEIDDDGYVVSDFAIP